MNEKYQKLNSFFHLVDKYDGNRYVKYFTCWNQLLSLMFLLKMRRKEKHIISVICLKLQKSSLTRNFNTPGTTPMMVREHPRSPGNSSPKARLPDSYSYLLGYGTDSPLHVFLKLCEKLNTVEEKSFKQVPLDVSFISDEFSIYERYEALILQRLSIINVSRCNHKIKKFTLLVAYQVKHESEEPAHRTLTPSCNALECLVHVYPLVLTDPKRCAVHKTDPSTFANKTCLMNSVRGWQQHLHTRLNDYRKRLRGIDVASACRPLPHKSV